MTVSNSSDGPTVVHWNVQEPMPPELERIVVDVRSQSNALVVVSGGASSMSESTLSALSRLFRAFEILSAEGHRLALGDGGTRAGIMEAAGRARAASGNAFALVGIAPAPEVGRDGRSGSTPIDENHSHIVTITNDPWLVAQKARGWEPSWGFWGSESVAMYEIFDRISAGRPSVAILANGGNVTLDEVELNLQRSRRIVLLEGSGRAADAIVALLQGKRPDSPDGARLEERVRALKVRDRAESFRVFPLDGGPDALATVLMEELQAAP